MRNLHGLSTLFLALALAGCGDDSSSSSDGADSGNGAVADGGDNAGFPDAAPSIPDAAVPTGPDAEPVPLECAGTALPTTVASPPVSISGSILSVATLAGPEPLASAAALEARNSDDDSLLLATESVPGNGTNTFIITDPNNSTTALDAYVKATADGHIDTYLFPPFDIYEDFDNALFLMFGVDLWNLVPAFAGATQSAENGAIMVVVADCDQNPMENATVSLDQNVGTIRYADEDGLPSTTAIATSSQGIAFIFDVPPGDYIIDAQRGGISLREHSITTFANSASTTIVVP